MDIEYNITYRQKDNGLQVIVSYKDSTGKWRQKSKQGFENSREGKKKAKIKADEILQEIKENLQFNINSDMNDITFKEFCDLYLEHKSLHIENATLSTYDIALLHFKDIYDVKLTSLTTLHIQKCVDKMIADNFKKSSINQYISKIKVILNAALNEYNIISKNPISKIKIPKDKKNKEKKALTKSELDDLLNKMKTLKGKNYTYYIVALIAGTCGLRVGEICGLRWSNIDFKNRKIIVSTQWKKNKDGTYGFGTLKSKNSYREVPITQYTINELTKYKNMFPIGIDNRVIQNKNTSSVSIIVSRYFKNLGYDVTIHELRHTYATLLIANGVDFKTAAMILGHDVEQTMKTYSHVNTDMLENARRIINNIL